MDNVFVVATVADAWSSDPDVVAKLLTRVAVDEALKTSHCSKRGLLRPRRGKRDHITATNSVGLPCSAPVNQPTAAMLCLALQHKDPMGRGPTITATS